MAAPANHSPKRWRKLLYIEQEYADNHVDASFLEEMQKNVNVRTFGYWALVSDSGNITQQLSSIVIFVGTFIELLQGRFRVDTLIGLLVGQCVLWHAAWVAASARSAPAAGGSAPSLGRFRNTAKGSAIFLGILLGLTPILRTLTLDTSNDTIWALSLCLFLCNFAFFEYSVSESRQPRLKGALSLNAAIFASVLLASRLPHNRDVFGFLSFAVIWFALFPIVRREIKIRCSRYYKALTVALIGFAAALLARTAAGLAVIFLCLVGLITFGCPYWFIYLQRYKNEIKGPWDEARLIPKRRPAAAKEM